jgi:hypothetical protein
MSAVPLRHRSHDKSLFLTGPGCAPRPVRSAPDLLHDCILMPQEARSSEEKRAA